MVVRGGGKSFWGDGEGRGGFDGWKMAGVTLKTKRG